MLSLKSEVIAFMYNFVLFLEGEKEGRFIKMNNTKRQHGSLLLI